MQMFASMQSVEYLASPVAGIRQVVQDCRSNRMVDTEYLAGQTLNRHYHEKPIIVLTLAGSYQQQVMTRTHLIKPGFPRFIPAGQKHLDRFSENTRCLIIEIGDSLLSRFVDRLGLGEMAGPSSYLIGQRLVSEFHNPDQMSPLVLEALTLELIAAAKRHSDLRERSVPPWLKRVRKDVEDRFAERVTLQEIADSAGIHVVHLCRSFRQHYGCTIGDHIRQLRVARALDLLSNTRKSLAEISNVCGFSDQNHFTEVLKKHVGITPGVFRRANKS
jgi:AraC family transcriptional regulator